MTFQMIDTADPNFPVNLFAPEEDATEVSNSDCTAISCCGYATSRFWLDSIWETDVDE